MRQTTGLARKPAETVIKNIRRAMRRHFSSEDKIRIVLEGAARTALPGHAGARASLRPPMAAGMP